MKTFIRKHLQGRKILLLFIITSIIYALMLLVTIPKLSAFAEGKAILDMMPGGYDQAYVLSLMETLGQEGRDFYISRQMPLDFLYPGLFAITYSLLFAYLLQQINKLQTPYLLLAYLPLVAGIADYCENIGILSMASSYPDISSTTVTVASAFTILKSVVTSIYFVALFVLIVVYGIKRSRKSG